ncbi:transposase [Patescibacteria group bacterium]|nr:transposase [Patescibacteria group bacterium]
MGKRIIFENGHYYHIYNRGVGKDILFKKPSEYLFFLKKIKKYLHESDVSLICYCLMPNHYHFILQQIKEFGISDFIMRLSTSYTQSINKKYERSGVLFQGSFKAKHIDREEYLIYLCQYIHLNPIKANIVLHPDYWPYMNWLEFINKRNGSLFSLDFKQYILQNHINYQRLVLDFLKNGQVDDRITSYMLD